MPRRRRSSHKARFSSSESWDMSKAYSGKLLKLTGKVHKSWKVYHICLRDDTSFRWYKDDAFLDRRGELWIEEVALSLRFGQDAITEYGPLPKAQRSAEVTNENLIAFRYLDPTKKSQLQTLIFAAVNHEELVDWATRFADSLEANAVFAPESSPVEPGPPPVSYPSALTASPPAMRKRRSSWLKRWNIEIPLSPEDTAHEEP